MNYTPKQVNSLLVVIALCLSFTVNSIISTLRLVHRNATDEINIELAKEGISARQDAERRAESDKQVKICVDAGGIPKYDYSNYYYACDGEKK